MFNKFKRKQPVQSGKQMRPVTRLLNLTEAELEALKELDMASSKAVMTLGTETLKLLRLTIVGDPAKNKLGLMQQINILESNIVAEVNRILKRYKIQGEVNAPIDYKNKQLSVLTLEEVPAKEEPKKEEVKEEKKDA